MATPERMRPFANGTHYDWWSSRNCMDCAHDGACPLQTAIEDAAIYDGTIPLFVARRIGMRANGQLHARCGQFLETLGKREDSWRQALEDWNAGKPICTCAPAPGNPCSATGVE